MRKKLIKVKLYILLSLTFVLLTVPIGSVRAALDPDIGVPCTLGDLRYADCAGAANKADCPCIGDAANVEPPFTNYNGTTAEQIKLRCEANACVVPAEWAAIGTWCNYTGDRQCHDETNALTFTCNQSAKRCVVGITDVACIDELARGNKDDRLGDLLINIPESERCDTGLVCDVASGKCQNDFGQGKLPSKLGETAEDIRDQIRTVINIALGFLGVAGVIVTMYGGALWMSAAGDDEKVGKAKKTIVSGLIGLVIIGIAWTIVSYVLTITQDIA